MPQAPQADDTQSIIHERIPIYYAISTQIHNDLQRFLSVKDAWTSLDAKSLEAVKDYFAYHLTMIETHWHNQDEHFAPILSRFLPNEDTTVKMWVEGATPDRKRILVMQKEITQYLASDLGKVSEAFKAYCEFFEQYMTKEAKLIANIIRGTSREKFEEIEKAIMKEQDPREVKIIGAWILAGMDDSLRAAFFANSPFFLPFVWNIVLKRQFNKRVAVFKQFA